jgi:hypothetical protein
MEFREYLEDLAVYRQAAEIRFLGDNGGIANIRSRIKSLIVNENEAFIELENGLRIRIDQLVTVNGRPGNHFS